VKKARVRPPKGKKKTAEKILLQQVLTGRTGKKKKKKNKLR